MKTMFGVRMMDKVRNEEVHKKYGSEVTIGGRMDRNVLSWYDSVESMEEEMVFKSLGRRWRLVKRGKDRSKLG